MGRANSLWLVQSGNSVGLRWSLFSSRISSIIVLIRSPSHDGGRGASRGLAGMTIPIALRAVVHFMTKSLRRTGTQVRPIDGADFYFFAGGASLLLPLCAAFSIVHSFSQLFAWLACFS